MIRWLQTDIGAIGFHGIPVHVSDGSDYQTEAELGTRLSGGCQRQANPDAAFLWAFAPGRHDRRRPLTPMRFGLQLRADDPTDSGCRGPARRGARVRHRARRRPRRQRLEPAAVPRRGGRRRRSASASARSCSTPASTTRCCWPARSLTLDRLSGGRVELGLGAGHTPAEFAATGRAVPPRRRAQGAAGRVRRGRPPAPRRRDGRPPRRALRPGRRSIGPASPARVPILVGGSGPGCSSTPPATPTSSASPGSGAPCPTATATPRASSRPCSMPRPTSCGTAAGERAVELNVLVQVVDVTADREAAAAAPGRPSRTSPSPTPWPRRSSPSAPTTRSPSTCVAPRSAGASATSSSAMRSSSRP